MARRSTSPTSLAHRLIEIAHAQGFDLVAALPSHGSAFVAGEAQGAGSPLISPRAASHYRDWLAQGFHGEMTYLSRPDAVSSRLHPDNLLPGLRSILIVGANYHSFSLPQAMRDDPSRGVVSRYAWGSDYHALMEDKLASVARSLADETGQAFECRACVDTGAVLEREIAAQAGLGFLGKNTCLINPGAGSWLFLGELLLTLDLPVSPPRGLGLASVASCGRCSRCLEACPTGALVAPHVMDARRCISYLTIELRGPVPRELRPFLGNHIFGCDICQEACPWNERFASPTCEPGFYPGPDSAAPHLLDLFTLDDAGFAHRFRQSAIRRTRRRGLLRNAAIALGNWGSVEAVPTLVRAMHDSEPLVRGHSAWALGCIGTRDARIALKSALLQETDRWARSEIAIALSGM